MKKTLANALLMAVLCLFSGLGTAFVPVPSSGEKLVAPPPCTLPPPTGFMPTKVTPTSISFKWNAVQGALKYRIRTLNVATGQFVTPHIITPDLMATKNGLTPNTLYQFFIEAQCTNGAWSGQSQMLMLRTSIIINDIVYENCCPLPSTPRTQASGTTTTYTLDPALPDAWHIRAEKYTAVGGAYPYFDFCLADTNTIDLAIHQYGSSNTSLVTNTGALATVKQTAPLANFLTIGSLSFDYVTTLVTVTVTWKAKMRVYDAYCDTAGYTGQAGERMRLNSDDWHVLPNPFSSEFHVVLPESETEELADAQLFDAQGRLVGRVETAEPQIIFETANLPAGLYFLKIQRGAEQRTFKVLKN